MYWEGPDHELYGERVIAPERTPMRVSFAAHGTKVDARWLALVLGEGLADR